MKQLFMNLSLARVNRKLLVIGFILFCFNLLSVGQTELPVDSAEAEDGALTGVNVSKSVSGYSGTGYVTGLDLGTDKMTVTLHVPAKDFYKLVIRYNRSIQATSKSW